ncbi:hypothetical protein HDU88_002337 [Geranomyces variabilis]|nr:hypothetical protein HDU88_002337 [Geranomyces variabilis]
MLKATTPVAVLLCGWMLGAERPNMQVFAKVTVIVFGVILASYGEFDFILVGVIFQTLGIAFEATRLVMVQNLLHEYKMDPLCSLYHFAPICALMNAVACAIFEGPKFNAIMFDKLGPFTLLANSAVAFGLNCAVVFLIGKTSSLVMCLSGIVKDILLVVVSSALWGTRIGGLQAFGYSITLVGLLWYKQVAVFPFGWYKHIAAFPSVKYQAMKSRKRSILAASIISVLVFTVGYALLMTSSTISNNGSCTGWRCPRPQARVRQDRVSGVLPPGGAYKSNATLTAIIFYGRRRYARLLSCYLERNLVRNGGILEKVIWVQRTTAHEPHEPDTIYLNDLVSQTDGFETRILPYHYFYYQWAEGLRDADPEKYYVKIDDDVVFIEDGAFEAMRDEIVKNRFYMVSANVVAHGTLISPQVRMGRFHHYNLENHTGVRAEPFLDNSPLRAIHEGWRAPADPQTCVHQNWECVAIAHYNFLDSYDEDRTLPEYRFPLWDFHTPEYVRFNINMVVAKDSELIAILNAMDWTKDDEEFMSVTWPTRTGRHAAAVGNAMAAHFSYFPARKELDKTDVLKRYERIALQHCPTLVDYDTAPEAKAAAVAAV